MTETTLNTGEPDFLAVISQGESGSAGTDTPMSTVSHTQAQVLGIFDRAQRILLFPGSGATTATDGAISTTRLESPPAEKLTGFDDLLAELGADARAAFADEERHFNQNLDRRYAAGKISSLEYYRKRARLSQSDLADAIGSNQPYMSLLEKGERGLTRKMAERLSDVLGVTVGELLEVD